MIIVAKLTKICGWLRLVNFSGQQEKVLAIEEIVREENKTKLLMAQGLASMKNCINNFYFIAII